MSGIAPQTEDMQPGSATITRRSKSNLALMLACLPAEKRRDMVSFYAFCRVIDDLADDPALPRHQKEEGLERWRRGIMEGFADPDPLESEVVALQAKYGFPRELLIEILAGVGADLDKKRYGSWEELREYCYRVACVVGLVSIEIFGYRNDGCRDYAINLGYALQLTNILRDVEQDLASDDRIYLPSQDMAVCGYSEADLRGRCYDGRFLKLMRLEADRADTYFRRAVASLPREDERAMVAAEMMRKVYAGILKKMQGDGFRVFQKRYRLGKARMLAILGRGWLRRWTG